MATHIDADEASANIARYIQRVASTHERILVIQQGRPVAAVVGVEDLERLEAMTEPPQEPALAPPHDAAFRQALEDMGMVVQWPNGPGVALSERSPLPIAGPPLSEQILADRR
jgi:prevent-host-death family protein